MKGQRDQLISEVRKFPALFNTALHNYKDTNVRDRCWNEIAKRLKTNIDILKREWKILRDSYRQVVRKRSRMKTNGETHSKNWRYENQMAFLLPFMTERESGESKPIASGVTEHAAEEMPDEESDTMELQPAEYIMPDSDLAKDQKMDFWDAGNNSHDQVDAMELFFSSVCQTAKKLPKKLQNRIKREVLDIVMKAEEEYEEQHN